MKYDVVVAYYRQEHNWPVVAWGLEQNAARINRVLVVNDEPWSEFKPTLNGIPVVLLDHPHDGFGLTKSYNQGMREATTDFVLLTQGDEILVQDFFTQCIGALKDKSILYPIVAYTEPDVELADMPPPFVYGDWRLRDQGEKLAKLSLIHI